MPLRDDGASFFAQTSPADRVPKHWPDRVTRSQRAIEKERRAFRFLHLSHDLRFITRTRAGWLSSPAHGPEACAKRARSAASRAPHLTHSECLGRVCARVCIFKHRELRGVRFYRKDALSFWFPNLGCVRARSLVVDSRRADPALIRALPFESEATTSRCSAATCYRWHREIE